ncbi:MAG: TauD/TfdA family dioxygenase [Candidatus Eremiobacteraeota bacterium]|nr:TauD/TfdA family dioxygenase [Candidatus Eremiobacteraeota bacterium]
MIGTILTEPVRGPVAWSGADFKPDSTWIQRLSSAQVDELERAATKSLERSADPTRTTRADFPLETLGPRIAGIAEELDRGRGFALLRGMPVQRWGDEVTARVLWGIGTYLGVAIPQNARGDVLGHVRDEGRALAEADARGYQTREAQSLHVDRCDVVGLLCLRAAKAGGTSRVVSSMRIYNELLARAPWLVGVLYKAFAVDLRGEQLPGQSPVYYRPVYSYYGGVLSCGCNYTYIRSGQERIGAPLTAVEREALDTFYAIADELALAMDLEPGDFQLLNNYVTLHDRTAYEDYVEPERQRHMLRLWLRVTPPRPLSPDFGTYDFANGR